VTYLGIALGHESNERRAILARRLTAALLPLVLGLAGPSLAQLGPTGELKPPGALKPPGELKDPGQLKPTGKLYDPGQVTSPTSPNRRPPTCKGAQANQCSSCERECAQEQCSLGAQCNSEGVPYHGASTQGAFWAQYGVCVRMCSYKVSGSPSGFDPNTSKVAASRSNPEHLPFAMRCATGSPVHYDRNGAANCPLESDPWQDHNPFPNRPDELPRCDCRVRGSGLQPNPK